MAITEIREFVRSARERLQDGGWTLEKLYWRCRAICEVICKHWKEGIK